MREEDLANASDLLQAYQLRLGNVGIDQMQAKMHLYTHISTYIKAFKYK